MSRLQVMVVFVESRRTVMAIGVLTIGHLIRRWRKGLW